jgi:hypothetical protein
VVLADLSLQTAIANQINLVVQGAGGSLQFWNGGQTNPTAASVAAAGGAQAPTGPTPPAPAATTGAPVRRVRWPAGTVTVVGNQAFTGMQFLTDGYQLVAGNNAAA